MKRSFAFPLLSLAALALCSACSSRAQLDPSFGSGGIVSTEVGSKDAVAHSLALQADGKIVVAGGAEVAGASRDFALARFLPDGTLDSSFGAGGRVTTTVSPGVDEAMSVAVQADGKLVVAGRSGTQFAVARYLTTGGLDPSFGGTGVVRTALVADEQSAATSVAVQADGRIVAAGWAGQDFGLARYLTDGALDTSFDGDGLAMTSISPGSDQCSAMVIDATGHVVATGTASKTLATVRYNPDGSPDATFGSGGIATTTVGSKGGQAYAIAIDDKSRIVIGGYRRAGAHDDALIARYHSDGVLDTGLDGDGTVTTQLADGDDWIFGVAVQADGKIVAAGAKAAGGGKSEVVVVRYRATGKLDDEFGDHGVLATQVGADSIAQDIALQPDGKIVVAGHTIDGSDGARFLVARYLPGSKSFFAKLFGL